ncbi:MAG: DUF1176 domain-containing protein [Rhizobiales bacterium]|nr:DUF1176 domain-containing protein [Hyphomicrobiales bacterium]
MAEASEASFEDWTVACRKDGYCVAETQDARAAAGPLRIGRINSAGAKWEISVSTRADNPALFGPVGIRVPGQRQLRLAPNRDYATFGDPEQYFLINSSGLQPLFRRMIESRHLFVTFDARDRREIDANYSLKGLKDALLWIDEQQENIGSDRTAGPPSATGGAAPITAPTVSDILDPEQLALDLHGKIGEATGCTVRSRDGVVSGEAAPVNMVEKLDDRNSLVLIACALKPAGGKKTQNTPFQIYKVDRAKATAQLLVWAVHEPLTGWTGSATLVNARFDLIQKTLSMIEPGSEAGDCGRSGVWLWQAGQFVLTEFRVKPICDGLPGVWPLVTR